MNETCIAVDALGGEYSPGSVVEGIRLLDGSLPVKFLLVGDQERIRACNLDGLNVEIVHTDQVVDMAESPGQALKRKRQSSIAVAVGLVKEKRAQAVFSAGNTGAMMAFSLFELGRLEGVSRPALATIVASRKQPTVLVDVGANVDCKPQWLAQFAIMARAYVQSVFQIENPTVGLLSIGEEAEKGNEQTLATYKILQDADISFIGNVEGHDITLGKANVIVADGFVGNVILKLAEGLSEMILHTLKSELAELRQRVEFSPDDTLAHFLKQLDYAEYGAALLLGVNGNSLIGHGKSSPKAVANALRQAYRSVHYDMNDQIVAEIKRCNARMPVAGQA